VYKLAAIKHVGQEGWTYKIKLSEQVSKISTPGIQQVRRFFESDRFVCDMIYDETIGQASSTIIDPVDFTRRKKVSEALNHEDLLVPIFRSGKLVYERPSIKAVREYSRKQLSMLHPTITRLLNPHQYPVGIEKTLHDLKTQLILEARTADS
jgi:nicotinate phosphoribosyltransferase